MVRRALVAEGLGSTLLAATVIGSGIMAERLAGGNLALTLLANTAATVAVLGTYVLHRGEVQQPYQSEHAELSEQLYVPSGWRLVHRHGAVLERCR